MIHALLYTVAQALLLVSLTSPVASAATLRQQRKMQEDSTGEADEGRGFFERMFDPLVHYAVDKLWNGFDTTEISRSETFSDTGAEVYLITFSEATKTALQNGQLDELNNLNITRVTQQNGINGNPRNRYVWSMALDDKEDLYLGTLNQNYDGSNLTCLVWSIFNAPWGQKFDALVDTLLRQWSGLPVFESDGGGIFYKSKERNNFELKFQATPEHLGFRNMVNYNGNIYAGSANGPNGPYDGASYNFEELYVEDTGAKIFTNAGGNGTFDILDDEGLLDGFDKTIRGLVVSNYSNRLYIGTETYECGKLLAYNDKPATPEGRFTSFNFENTHCGLSVSQLYYMGDGKLLFGAWKELGYAVYMLDEKNNDEIVELVTPDWPLHLSMGVMEIRLFKDYLYVGVLSFVQGFALIRTPMTNADDLKTLSADDWEVITMDGFQKEQQEQLEDCNDRVGNDYTWTSAEVNGIYFLGTFAGSSRSEEPTGQLWGSYDGLDWRLIKSDVLSSRYMYGYRTMEATKDETKLYIGSATNMYIPDRDETR